VIVEGGRWPALPDIVGAKTAPQRSFCGAVAFHRKIAEGAQLLGAAAGGRIAKARRDVAANRRLEATRSGICGRPTPVRRNSRAARIAVASLGLARATATASVASLSA
jgi:hypothetical protein